MKQRKMYDKVFKLNAIRFMRMRSLYSGDWAKGLVLAPDSPVLFR
jgi:hypothetical protein